jgi:transcriptional regulator with XRE-family HTH domain
MKTDPRQWKALVAERLADALSEKGLKQNDLAERLGVSEPAVSRWVSERGGVGWKRLAEICSAIGVPADRLLGLEVPARQKRTAPRVPVAPDEYIRFRLHCPHCKNVIEETKIDGKAANHRRGRKKER